MGERRGEILGPGPYLKWPWPFERIERLDTTTVRRVDLGGEAPKVKPNQSILWTNDHGVQEEFFLVRSSVAERQAERDDLNEKDVSLIAAEVPLLYEVKDFSKFELLASPEQRDQIIRSVARREVFRHLAQQPWERLLGAGRTEISGELRERVEAALDSLDAGVKVLFVGVEGVHPPKDTAMLFESVVQGRQQKAASIERGENDANKRLIEVAGSVETARKLVEAIDAAEAAPKNGASEKEVRDLEITAEQLLSQATGKAATLLHQAKAERWTKHMNARARAERYTGQLASFRAAPSVYKSQIYFDTLADALKDARVYIVSPNVVVSTNAEDSAATGSLLTDTPKKKEE
jgi:regulator of protease activity HflC (stomatin/prohibitin superfamily)